MPTTGQIIPAIIPKIQKNITMDIGTMSSL